MAISKEKLVEYINETKSVVLATVTKSQSPEVRSLGSFGTQKDLVTYFSTQQATEKVSQIAENPQVTILFQHEDQEIQKFINVTLSGKAIRIEGQEDINKAIEVIGKRNPRFLERFKKGELKENAFFKVLPYEAKVLDFSQGIGAQAVQKIQL